MYYVCASVVTTVLYIIMQPLYNVSCFCVMIILKKTESIQYIISYIVHVQERSLILGLGGYIGYNEHYKRKTAW